jgi:hypothetical protein
MARNRQHGQRKREDPGLNQANAKQENGIGLIFFM